MPKGIYERKPRGTDNGDSAPRRGPGRPRRELQPLDWRNTSAAERIELDEHGSPVLDDAPVKLIERSPIDETAPWGEIEILPAEEAPLRPDKKGVYRELAELLLDKLVDGADRRFVVTVAFADNTRALSRRPRWSASFSPACAARTRSKCGLRRTGTPAGGGCASAAPGSGNKSPLFVQRAV